MGICFISIFLWVREKEYLSLTKFYEVDCESFLTALIRDQGLTNKYINHMV